MSAGETSDVAASWLWFARHVMRRLIATLAASILFAGVSAPLAHARPPDLGYREAWQAALRANIVIHNYKIRLRDEAHQYPDADGFEYRHAEWPKSHRKRRDVVRFWFLADGDADCKVQIALGVRKLADREARAEHRRYRVRVLDASESEYGCNG